jgi:hypothetical protein
LEYISDVIIMVGKITLTLPENKEQKAILHNLIEKHLQVYEQRCSSVESNPILNLSTKTPLQYIQEEDLLLIRVLLKECANPNLKNHERCTALHLLAENECRYIFKWVVQIIYHIQRISLQQLKRYKIQDSIVTR